MELLHNLAVGLGVAFTLQNLLCALVGCLLGTLIGVLPGIGPMAAIAMLLPATQALPAVSALILLAGVYDGARRGGATAAMLVNLPGESLPAVTVVDGYQMARKGRAGPALAAADMGAFVAGGVGALALAALAAPLTRVAAAFGPAEYFSLLALGLTGAVALAAGAPLKALGMAVLGLLLGLVGTGVNSGAARFVFNRPEWADGTGFIVIAMGVFGYGQIIAHLSRPQEKREVCVARVERPYPTRDDCKRMTPAIMRGTLFGSALGVLPGGGAVLAAFAAYAVEKKTRLKPGEAPFGKGNIRGVAAPQAARDAGARTAFISLLTLGMAPNAALALLMGAMMLHHVPPGPRVMTGNPELFWGLIGSMWIGSLLLIVLNLPLIGIWLRLLAAPYRWLFPAVALFGAIGAYSLGHNVRDVWLVGGFGVAGYVFIELGMALAPLLLGFIFGPLMEDNLRRALLLSRGEWSVLVTRPLSAALLGAAALLLVMALLPAVQRVRRNAFVED